MVGRLFVDGIDVYSQFGVYAIEGGWNELIAWPPLKAPKTYEFPEHDGVEADLSSPRLDTREFNIKFAISGYYANFFGFVAMLSDGAYHTFNIESIQRTYTLRLVSHGEQDLVPLLGFMTFRFADDFPEDKLTDAPATSHMLANPEYQIGDFDSEGNAINLRPLSAYGARVLEGAYSQLTKLPQVRKNLIIKGSTLQGVIYDPEVVTYQAKDITLTVLFRANTLDELWRNYDALLTDLVRPEERALAVWFRDIDQTFPCYYKKSSVKEFFPNGKIWLRVDITLTITRDMRIVKGDTLLASEGYDYITTEDGASVIVRPKYGISMLTDETGAYIVTEDGANKIFINHKKQ